MLSSPAPSPDTGVPELSAAVFITDPSGVISAWSPAAAGVTGYTAAEIIGSEVSLLYAPEERAEGHPYSDLALAARRGRSEHQGWMLRKDGGKVWAETAITALRNETGLVSGFACFARDHAAEKNADARRRARAEKLSLLAVGRADLAGAGLDLPALLRRIALRARDLTNAEAAIIEMRDGVGERARAYDGNGEMDVELGAILVPQGTPRADGRFRCIRYDFRHESEEVLGDVCDRIGIGSLLAIPVVHDRVTIAWLAAFSRQSRAFGDEAAATLELMASLLGASLTQAQAAEQRQTALAERSRDQAGRREREASFRAAMDASHDAFVILGAVRNEEGAVIDFVLRDANQRAEVLCALPHDAFEGLRLAALPDARAQLPPVATMARVVETATADFYRQAADDASVPPGDAPAQQIVPFGDGVLVTIRSASPY